MLIFKNNETRNQVKSALASEFINKLGNITVHVPEKRVKLVNNVNNVNPELVARLSSSLGVRVDPTSDILPCININCRWIEFLDYFYAKKVGYWSLPATTSNGHCEICRQINSGECRFSDIKISHDMVACVRDKKL